MYSDPNDGPAPITRAESDALADRLILALPRAGTVSPVPCRNAACPDPGDHGHLIDSRDDLEAARWAGYTPTVSRAETLATVAQYGGTHGGPCKMDSACDGCPQHDR